MSLMQQPDGFLAKQIAARHPSSSSRFSWIHQPKPSEAKTTMAITTPRRRRTTLLFSLLISWSIISPAASSIPHSTASSSASKLDSSDTNNDIRRPPWNPSQQINNQGYLKQLFRRIPAEIIGDATNNNNHNHDDKSLATPVVIRQVRCRRMWCCM